MSNAAEQRLTQAQQRLRECEELVSAAELAAVYDRLAAQSAQDLQGLAPLVLCVMVGGLYATAEVTRRWNFAHDLGYLHATRYRGATAGGALHWQAPPSQPVTGRHVLIIDDILDEGTTLVAIQQALQADQPASIRTLVTCSKLHQRRDSRAHADYVGVELPDRYVLGAGMDYHEAHRQYDRILALPSRTG
jgi:hypoxanthine phosphoribosyltransferase